jgi:hypothetical protein
MELDMIKPLLLDSMNLQTTSKLESMKSDICKKFMLNKSVNKLNLSHNLLHSLEVSFDLIQVNSFHFYLDVGAAYSPMSYSGTVTPSSQWIFNQNPKETGHYLELIKTSLRRHSGDFHVGFSGGSLIISRGVQTVVQLRDVTEAVHLSNIYHVIKAMEFSLNDCFAFLQEFGIPTLVQATHTGWQDFQLLRMIEENFDPLASGF